MINTVDAHSQVRGWRRTKRRCLYAILLRRLVDAHFAIVVMLHSRTAPAGKSYFVDEAVHGNDVNRRAKVRITVLIQPFAHDRPISSALLFLGRDIGFLCFAHVFTAGSSGHSSLGKRYCLLAFGQTEKRFATSSLKNKCASSGPKCR